MSRILDCGKLANIFQKEKAKIREKNGSEKCMSNKPAATVLQTGGIAQASTAVKGKRLRCACGALDNIGRLYSEVIKKGFDSLCSSE